MKVKLNPCASIAKLSNELAAAHDADVLLYAGEIREPFDYVFLGKVRHFKSKTNVVLILTTYGGSADSAYRMMRGLQSSYDDGKITLLLPSFCKSAGTLAAVGADEIVMSSTAELGPLDVQLRKPDEVGEWASGLTPLQALAALRGEAFNCFEQHFLLLRESSGHQITAKTAAEIATKLTIGWFQPIYEQLDPMRLSETQRAMMIAREYGMRLARKNITEESLDAIITAYPSHGFVIDRAEAATLFNKVRGPEKVESKLSLALIRGGVLDAGINGDQPEIVALSSEECPISVDNKWEGMDHEIEEKKPNAETKGQPSDGKADGASHAQSVHPPDSVASGGNADGSQPSAGRGNGHASPRVRRVRRSPKRDSKVQPPLPE